MQKVLKSQCSFFIISIFCALKEGILSRSCFLGILLPSLHPCQVAGFALPISAVLSDSSRFLIFSLLLRVVFFSFLEIFGSCDQCSSNCRTLSLDSAPLWVPYYLLLVCSFPTLLFSSFKVISNVSASPKHVLIFWFQG